MTRDEREIRAAWVDAGLDWDEWVRSRADHVAAVQYRCWPDVSRAERVKSFFERDLRHFQGEFSDQPFILLPWQWDEIIKPLFSWVRPDDTRRFRRAGIWVAKKNGKTTLCSGLALYLLCFDDEPGAEVFSAAKDREQAALVYRAAAHMVAKSPKVREICQVYRTPKAIVYEDMAARYMALSSDAATKEGVNCSGLLFDEIHVQRDRTLWDALRYSGASRRQPLIITISTAGNDQHGLGYEEYKYAKQCASDNIVDIEFLPVVHEVDTDADWTDESLWVAANPSLGTTVKIEELRHAAEEAKISPAKERSFRRYRLNQWLSGVGGWLSSQSWKACAYGLDEETLEGRPCFGGLDLASTKDIAAFVLVFPIADLGLTPQYAVKCWFWCPEDTVLERSKDNANYMLWTESGMIQSTEGAAIDYETIKTAVMDAFARYNIVELAYDPWQATKMAQELDGEGLTMVQMSQSYRTYTEPCNHLEKLVTEQTLEHFENPVLAWMCDNMTIDEPEGDRRRPSKRRSRGKIDGMVALLMGLGRAIVHQVEPTEFSWSFH